MTDNMQVIVGAGAVGTTLAAYLLQAGQQVALLVRPERLAHYHQADRLQLLDSENQALIDVPAPLLITSLQQAANCNTVYLTTKYTGLNAALDNIADDLPANCRLIPCLNGVGLAKRIGERCPQATVQPMTIMFNAAVAGPLTARLTTTPEIRLHDASPAQLQSYNDAGLVAKPGSEALSWGKLLINMNNSICALTGTGFADVMLKNNLTEAYLAAANEAVSILNASKEPWQLPLPYPWPLFKIIMRHAGWLAYGMGRLSNGLTRATRPSMVADMEAGRLTEIDELNGAVVRLAQQHGLDAPVNQRIVDLLKGIEGQTPPAYLQPAALRSALKA